MGLGIIEDLFPGTGFHKLFQNPADPGVIDTGIQLAIGKRTGTAFAKLDVASGIQNAGFKELLHLFMAGSRILAPFQHQGLPAGNGQHQSCKHTCGAKTNHHGAFFRYRNVFCSFIVGYRCNGGPLAAALLQQTLFVAVHRHIDGINDFNIRLLPGIHTAADNPKVSDFRNGDAQHLGCFKLELMCIMLRG